MHESCEPRHLWHMYATAVGPVGSFCTVAVQLHDEIVGSGTGNAAESPSEMQQWRISGAFCAPCIASH